MYSNKKICKQQKLKQKDNVSPDKINKKEKNNKMNDEEDNEVPLDMVSYEDNHIYFYDEVNTKSILLLIKYIKIINSKLQQLKMEIVIKYDSFIEPEIYLHINSYGGYITDALAGVDAIRNSKIPITTIVEGVAASSATLLSIVGKKRQINKNSSMLIHQLSGGFDGTHQQMKDDLLNSNYLEATCNNIYLENTKNKLTKKILLETLKHDLWWSSEKCLKYGLVDEII
tara:strand:- start:462 stop:1145 length:684 start_codon:yes stop_codon:yes gene_type:complete